MVKVVLSLLALFSFVFGEVINTPISPEVVSSGIKIIDIRTEPEWMQTGIIKDSKTITFFDRSGRYDVVKFLKRLNLYIKKNEKFAIVCRTGHRSRVVSKFLDERGYRVVDLLGGVKALAKMNYKFVKYEKNR